MDGLITFADEVKALVREVEALRQENDILKKALAKRKTPVLLSRACADTKCAASFVPRRKDQRYCSEKCQNRAKQRNRMARLREEAR